MVKKFWEKFGDLSKMNPRQLEKAATEALSRTGLLDPIKSVYTIRGTGGCRSRHR
jgi:hypothetical protein